MKTLNLLQFAGKIKNLYSRKSNNTAEIYTTYKDLLKIQLEMFRLNAVKLSFPSFPKPDLTIVIILYNKPAFLLNCLLSIHNQANVSYKILLIDNNSTEKMSDVISGIENVTYIKNNENKHFVLGVNQALQLVDTEFVCLLNYDSEVFPGAFSTGVNFLKTNPGAGVVGGKLVYPTGFLQEAGSALWKNGVCSGYGRNDAPAKGEYNFLREVDFVSGAIYISRTALVKEVGVFDERLAPAYYEEVDLSLKILGKGYKVFYHPQIILKHFEYGTITKESAIKLMERNRGIFLNIHKQYLEKNCSEYAPKKLLQNFYKTSKKKILYIDERIPHEELGAGYPRAKSLIKILHELGFFITFLPLECSKEEDWTKIRETIPLDVEVLIPPSNDLSIVSKTRTDFYDLIIVSRPNVMAVVEPTLRKWKKMNANLKIIYDAEALHSERMKLFFHLHPEKKVLKLNFSEKKELDLTNVADAVFSVSEKEKQKFETRGKKTYVVSHYKELSSKLKTFNERKDILFLGAFHDINSPNSDSMIWFLENVFQRVISKIPDIRLKIVGYQSDVFFKKFSEMPIDFYSNVSDPLSFFHESRIFIIPTRHSAGIPLKFVEATSQGIVSVVSSLISSQLNVKDGNEVRIGKDEESFAQAIVDLYTNEAAWNEIQKNALEFFQNNFTKEIFKNTVFTSIQDLLLQPTSK